MTTVTLLTEEQGFAQKWQRALSEHGFESRVLTNDRVTQAAQQNAAVIVDAAQPNNNRDTLLTILGFLRASGAVPAVHLDGDNGGNESILDDLCAGLIARNDQDIDRIAQRLAHRLDPSHRRRIEFVSVSPRADSVLSVFGNGDASLFKRPLGDNDDGSPIVDIQLNEDATAATLQLQNGATCTVRASEGSNGQQVDVDGEKLGARLKAFRLAAGLTQAELARRTGIHRPNIARVEAGRHTPSLETLSRIANAIGVSPTEVLAAH